jgi:hypothetical protein
MMRWPGIIRLDAFQLRALKCSGLPLHFFFQSIDEFALLNDDFIHLVNLVFQMSDVGFEALQPFGQFFVHGSFPESSHITAIRQSILLLVPECADEELRR